MIFKDNEELNEYLKMSEKDKLEKEIIKLLLKYNCIELFTLDNHNFILKIDTIYHNITKEEFEEYQKQLTELKIKYKG